MIKQGTTSTHTPVLVSEVLKAIDVQPGGRYIDCTLGTGGHATAILEKSSPGGQLLGIDADPEAIKVAKERFKDSRDTIHIVNDNFINLQSICFRYDFFPVHGILFDLGLSSLQINGNGRGFSFQHDAPLDMRLNPKQKTTAAHIVNNTPEARLSHLLKTYGEEKHGLRIARQIIQERPIKTTHQLARLIERVVGRRGKLHPATKTFLALRIAVNHELEHLEMALRQAIDLLGYEGKLAVISYHSLEDRIVKQSLREESTGCICPPAVPVCTCAHVPRLRIINRKVITPSAAEITKNPRSRSARLRAAERILPQESEESTAEGTDLITVTKSHGWRRPNILNMLKVSFVTS